MNQWEIKPDGANVIATNRVTGEIFSGTRAQLNTKLISRNRDNFSKTLVSDDAKRILSSDSDMAVSYTIPPDKGFKDFRFGDKLTAYRAGKGAVSFVASPGVTLVGVAPAPAQYSSLEVQHIGVDTWAFVNQAASRCLKNFTGANVLTGGTINTKTLLMQVPLPDGCLLDYRAGIRVSAIFGFTLNTNSKACGVDIGTSFGTATNLWSRTRASATSGAESILIDFQRSPLDSTKLLLAYGQAAPYEGAPNNNISTYTLHYSINPASTGLSLYFWGNLITANTDQVTLARAKVELATAEN